MARILVGVILHPDQCVPPGIGLQRLPGHRQQGSPQREMIRDTRHRGGGAHAAQAGYAAAAQEPQQNRFGLVILMVGGKQDIARPQETGDGLITGGAGRLFQTAPESTFTRKALNPAPWQAASAATCDSQ